MTIRHFDFSFLVFNPGDFYYDNNNNNNNN